MSWIEVRENNLEKAIRHLRRVAGPDLAALRRRSDEITRADRRRAKQRRAALRREEAAKKFMGPSRA